MKKDFALSIKSPCSENWNHFERTSNGGFCHSCNKNVVDFTKMSEREIIRYFKNKPSNTCGRFHPDQLKIYSQKSLLTISPGWKLIHTGFLSLTLLLLNKQVDAKTISSKPTIEIVEPANPTIEKNSTIQDDEITIKGVVKDEYEEPLPGVSIYLKGKNTGTVSDLNGRFELTGKIKEGDIVAFSFIGFITEEYKVPKNTPENIEIPMMTLYMDIMGEVQIDGPYNEKKSGLENFFGKIKKLFS